MSWGGVFRNFGRVFRSLNSEILGSSVNSVFLPSLSSSLHSSLLHFFLSPQFLALWQRLAVNSHL